jgi:hypothetical protein
MTRWRFWITQIFWLSAATTAALTASRGSEGSLVMIGLLASFVISGFLMKWGSTKHGQEQETRIQSFMIPRVIATAFMWLMYLAGIFVSVTEIGGWAILLALVLMIPLIAVSGLMWTWERISGVKQARMLNATEHQEKRKREGIDSVLRDLSDDDLLRLRERLVDGSVNDEFLYEQLVGDDGELMYRGQ